MMDDKDVSSRILMLSDSMRLITALHTGLAILYESFM